MRIKPHSILLILIAINIVVFLLQIIFPDISSFLALQVSQDAHTWYPGAALAKQPWSVLTYQFLHIDYLNLLVNMLLLYWIGSILLSTVEKRLFVSIILLSGILCGVIGSFIYSTLIGALPVIATLIGMGLIVKAKHPALITGTVFLSIGIATSAFSMTGFLSFGIGSAIPGFVMGLVVGVLLKRGSRGQEKPPQD